MVYIVNVSTAASGISHPLLAFVTICFLDEHQSVGMRWDANVVLLCFSLMGKDADRFSNIYCPFFLLKTACSFGSEIDHMICFLGV